jgi:hypothetical protein
LAAQYKSASGVILFTIPSPIGLSKNMGDLQLIVAHVILDVHMLRNILIVLGLP